MSVKKPGLGSHNSLGMLLSNISTQVPTVKEAAAKGELNQLPVEKIQRGKYQPRRVMDSTALQELADSIKVQGIIQPIVVRPISEDYYEIIAGERRWRAAQIAGLESVPVVIKDVTDEAAIAMALIENIQREDLNPIEESQALQRLIDEFVMTHQEVAQAVGKSRATVSNLLRLLTLNEDVKALLSEGKIDMGHAKVLLAITGSQQSQLARTVAIRGLTVRETEALVRQAQAPYSAKQKTQTKDDPNVKTLETDLAERLGARVNIQHKTTGKGKLVIQYNSLDELDGILEHIK